MKKIESVVIIGMGALGLLFGQKIHEALGPEKFCFLMDNDRARKHKEDKYTINGKEISFPIASPKDFEIAGNKHGFSADLVIVATKYSGLPGATELIKACGLEKALIISLLNGITSEEILAEKLVRDNIIDCIAIGMDAIRNDTDLVYESMGKLQVGISNESQKEKLDALIEFFDKTKIPYEVCDDIKKAMWVKFMMNVGINQTCMVYECTYQEALDNSPAKDDLNKIMHEIIRLSELEGVWLRESDYEKGIKIFRTLSPTGYPSMRQDALAKRPSEVELFSGTALRLGKKHGLDMPVNERFYQRIMEIESEYKDNG